jgi:uncharacterized OsmC-like protein
MATCSAPLNGVDLTAVAEITERYRRDPAAGHTRFEASVDWVGGYRTDARLGKFGNVRGDEPAALAGSGTGPTPEEMLLGAAAQCLIVGIAGSASARKIEIQRLRVAAHGTVNLSAAYGVEDGSPGFERVELIVDLEAHADREELSSLVDQALATAPIPNTVARPVPVSARLA